MKTCSRHRTYVEGYAGDLKQLARDLVDLRYDSLAGFLKDLGQELAMDSAADKARGRLQLGSALARSVNGVMSAWTYILDAWRISNPHMEVDHAPEPLRIKIKELCPKDCKECETYLVFLDGMGFEIWFFAEYRGGTFFPEDSGSFTIEPGGKYRVFSCPSIGPRSDKTYYVSGHMDLTEAEFEEHYVPLLDKALKEGARFVVGDAAGADAMAYDYIIQNTRRVVMYHMFEKPRNKRYASLKGGYRSDEERDAAMTADSDEDIAWVRPGRENSGTAKNLLRRSRNAKPA